MGAYNIVGASSLQAGQPEDVGQVLSNLQLIQAILNGGIDASNLNAAAGILQTQLHQWDVCAAHSSGTTVHNVGHTAMALDIEDIDTNSMHDPVTNNTRITAQSNGLYLAFGACYSGAAAPTGYAQTNIKLNGGAFVNALAGVGVPGDANVGANRGITWMIRNLVATDYLELTNYQDSGGDVTMFGQLVVVRLPS